MDNIDYFFLSEMNQPYLSLLFKSILCMGYYGLLRIGEMTQPEADHMIRFRDVYFGRNKNKVVIVLRSSKMYSLNCAPQIVKITRMEDKKDRYFQDIPKYCPFSILLDYLDARGQPRMEHEPFFIYRDGTPVKPDSFCTVLKLSQNCHCHKIAQDPYAGPGHKFCKNHM